MSHVFASVRGVVFLVGGFALALLPMVSQADDYLVFQVDNSRSYVDFSGDISGVVPITEHAPGSLHTTLSGSLGLWLYPGADAPIYVNVNGANLYPAPQIGTFLPGDQTAQLAGQATGIVGTYNGYGVFNSIVATMYDNFYEPIGGTGDFDASSIQISISSGLFTFEVPGLIPPTTTFLGATTQNVSPLPGNITLTDNLYTLTIPYIGHYNFQDASTGLTLNSTFQGQVVATSVVPELGSGLLAGAAAGALIVGGWIRRKRSR